MKKTFIKVSLIGLLAVSMPFSFTSCKDYDDDIEAVNQKTDGLSNQLAALETALANAQSAAAAAQKTADEAAKAAADAKAAGDAAAAEAAEAKAEAQKALAAAESAKAEAIEAAVAKVNELLKGYASAEDLATLAGIVEGIQKGLSELEEDLEELGAVVDQNALAITAIQTQIEALVKFEAKTEADLTTIKSDLEDLKSQIAGKMSEEDVIKLLTAAKEDITKEIGTAVGDAISTLKGVLSNRLTSVTLVPDLYIDGIETIEFLSLKYEPMKQGGATGLVKTGEAAVIVSSEENPAHYRLNPITTDLSDIDADNIEFVAYEAMSEMSRGAVASPIAYVKGSAEIAQSGVEKGIMTVRAKKTITGSLNLSGSKIYTVALKVPIASELCEKPDVPEYVYSEYSRLSENTVTPKIAEVKYDCPSGHKHYSDSVTIWASNVDANELVTKEVLYNQTLDIATLVTGCAKEDARELSAEELAKYGLEFRYAIPTAAYTTGNTNGTDQQKFIAINGSVVSSKTPDGATNNKAVVGKEPIVRVTLYDAVNKKIVDQRYLKIKWVEKTLDPVDLGVKEYTRTLGCGNTEVKLTWEDFINIYAEVKGDKLDMSKDQFTKVYLSEAPKMEVDYDIVDGPGMYLDPDNSADAAILTWVMTPAEIKKIVEVNTNVTPHTWALVDNVFTGTITFTPNNNDYPVLTLKLKQTVNVGTVPSINGFYGNYWTTPYTEYSVYPVQYGTPAQTTVGNQTCVFHNNIMNAFTFNTNNLIVNGLLDCGTWNMQFCKDHNVAGYAPAYTGAEPNMEQVSDNAGYSLYYNNTTLAVDMVWNDAHVAWADAADHNDKEVYLELQKNDAGIALLNKDAHLGVWATINPYNVIPVHDFDIKFVEPLNIKTAVVEDAFKDGEVSGSRIDWTKTFKIYDCFGYTVAKETTDFVTEKAKYAEQLYDYYEVEEPVWGVDDIKFGMKVENGNIVVDNNLTEAQAMSKATLESLTTGGVVPSLVVEGDELVFYSNMGSQVADFFYIWIPVTIEYGWGKVTTSVKVKVNALDNTPAE